MGAAPQGGRATGARRVVSLVPSITEALATARRDALVGATDWCTHPADLDVTRVRGTKNPDLAAIRSLRPDVVVANREENRELDVRRLRETGVQVEVTDVQTVPQAIATYQHLFDHILRWDRPTWLAEAERLWCGDPLSVTRQVVIPIWRDPWMVVGSGTFTGDLARRLGLANVFGDHPERYPHVSVEAIEAAGAELVLLPDEPYAFDAHDGPPSFTTPCALVSGRLLTWYGPSLIEAWVSLER